MHLIFTFELDKHGPVKKNNRFCLVFHFRNLFLLILLLENFQRKWKIYQIKTELTRIITRVFPDMDFFPNIKY